jgi:hypothetical protein
VKKEKSPYGGYTPANRSALWREKNDANESLSIISVEAVENLGDFKHINSLTRRDT